MTLSRTHILVGFENLINSVAILAQAQGLHGVSHGGAPHKRSTVLTDEAFMANVSSAKRERRPSWELAYVFLTPS